MTDQFKFCRRVLGDISIIVALTVGVIGAASGQTIEPQHGASSQTLYVPPSQQREWHNLPPAMRRSVAQSAAPCGGDFGMLGNLEAARHGVAQANPDDAPVCD